MTAHVPDHLINDHPRVNLRGLHSYGVICGNVYANYGWGERYYKFAHPACSALWSGCPATYRLDCDGRLTLLSFEMPLSPTRARTKVVNETLLGDFWLVMKPYFPGPRTYVAFKDGKIVEDESAWVIHEPRLGRTNGNERIIDLAARFIFRELPGQAIEEAEAFLAVPARSNWAVRLFHRSSDRPPDDLQESIVLVDEAEGEARWARMTEVDWEGSNDPSRMMLAIFDRISPLESWQLACALGRRFWDGFRNKEQERFAIETTERWLHGDATEDDLNASWFTATGAGACLQSGWWAALGLVNNYAGTTVSLAETCDLLRPRLGNVAGNPCKRDEDG